LPSAAIFADATAQKKKKKKKKSGGKRKDFFFDAMLMSPLMRICHYARESGRPTQRARKHKSAP